MTTRDPTRPGSIITYTAVLYPGLTDGIGLTRQRLLHVYWTATAGVAVLFLLACANVANLFISRNVRRRRELGLKAALGASRAQVLREVFVETSLLSLASGILGLALAAGLATFFRTDRLLEYLPPLEDLTVDWRVAAYALAGAVVTVLVAGGLPAILAARATPQAGLGLFMRGSGRGHRLRHVLMAAQVALSLALVASAGVLGRTLYSLEHVELGFNADHVLTLPLRPRAIGYTDERTSDFFRELETRLNATPGISAAGFALLGQLSSSGAVQGDVQRADGGPRPAYEVASRTVSANYFRTLDVPRRAGRVFTPAEAAQSPAPNVVVIDEALGKLLFGDSSPVAQFIAFPHPWDSRREPIRREVIGVVGNTASKDIREGFLPTLYVPAGPNLRIATFHIRSPLPVPEAAALVRRVVRELEPALPIDELTTMREDLGRLLPVERFLAKLGSILSLLALGIAVAGIYAVVACVVGERTHEFGIRLALGASRRRIQWEALRATAGVCAVGVVAGLGLYAWASRWIASRLFQVSPLDVPTLVSAATVLAACALLASWQPAYRAGRVDPMIALRAE